MIGSRLIWIFCLVGAVLFFLFSESWIALALLVVVVVIPLLMIVLNKLMVQQVDLNLEISPMSQKASESTGILRANNQGFIPQSLIVCKLSCENLLTGEVRCSELSFPVGARSQEELAFSIESLFCGTVKISLSDSRMYDPWGLWPLCLPADAPVYTCVLPNTFTPRLSVVQNMSKDVEADEYSQEKPGSDPSETFAIREYRAGDSLKRIHWKLSGKLEEIIVRESGLPVRHSFLILLETILPPGEKMQTPQLTDALAEITISICQILVEENIEFELAWYDQDSGGMFIRRVKNTEELSGLLGKFLSAQCKPGELNTFAHYAEAFGEAQFEHVVYISPFLSEGISGFTDEGRATAIICKENHSQSSSFMKTNVTTYYCSPSNYARDLAYLEL